MEVGLAWHPGGEFPKVVRMRNESCAGQGGEGGGNETRACSAPAEQCLVDQSQAAFGRVLTGPAAKTEPSQVRFQPPNSAATEPTSPFKRQNLAERAKPRIVSQDGSQRKHVLNSIPAAGKVERLARCGGQKTTKNTLL